MDISQDLGGVWCYSLVSLNCYLVAAAFANQRNLTQGWSMLPSTRGQVWVAQPDLQTFDSKRTGYSKRIRSALKRTILLTPTQAAKILPQQGKNKTQFCTTQEASQNEF